MTWISDHKNQQKKKIGGSGTQRAKFARKVHKPPFGVNVINFELNGFNVFLWVPWSLSEFKVFKFTKYMERNKMHFCPKSCFFYPGDL